jgi:hypothetical protein
MERNNFRLKLDFRRGVYKYLCGFTAEYSVWAVGTLSGCACSTKLQNRDRTAWPMFVCLVGCFLASRVVLVVSPVAQQLGDTTLPYRAQYRLSLIQRFWIICPMGRAKGRAHANPSWAMCFVFTKNLHDLDLERLRSLISCRPRPNTNLTRARAASKGGVWALFWPSHAPERLGTCVDLWKRGGGGEDRPHHERGHGCRPADCSARQNG